jgi:proline racemase
MTFKRMLHAVETHAGEPMRLITGGVPHIPGEFRVRADEVVAENDDQIRNLMLREPRGWRSIRCRVIATVHWYQSDRWGPFLA